MREEEEVSRLPCLSAVPFSEPAKSMKVSFEFNIVPLLNLFSTLSWRMACDLDENWFWFVAASALRWFP